MKSFSFYMPEGKNSLAPLINNVSIDHFWVVIRDELIRLGPSPRRPLNVKRAAEIAEVSQNTAGKYVDILAALGKIEIVANPPRKDLYLIEKFAESREEGEE
jgi:hypothetical protein